MQSYSVSLGDLASYISGVLSSSPLKVKVTAHSDNIHYDLQWYFGPKISTQEAHFILDSSSPPSSLKELIERNLPKGYETSSILRSRDNHLHFNLMLMENKN